MASESDNGKASSAEKVGAWMPLYIGDYLGDTMHLTNSQHGAYLLAIMSYWRKGESLTDVELKGVCKADTNAVIKFFVWCDGRWHHHRIDRELEKARANQAAARAKAMKGVNRRRELGLLPGGEPSGSPVI